MYNFPEKLSAQEVKVLLNAVQQRAKITLQQEIWDSLAAALTSSKDLWKLNAMEVTSGEPALVAYNTNLKQLTFYDCSVESPKERRSLCYDKAAWDARKEAKPTASAMEMVEAMGVEIMDESDYRALQNLGDFDLKTSSWIATPANIRALGGALFGDKRYATCFIYHNGASSYYAARGFRTKLVITL